MFLEFELTLLLKLLILIRYVFDFIILFYLSMGNSNNNNMGNGILPISMGKSGTDHSHHQVGLLHQLYRINLSIYKFYVNISLKSIVVYNNDTDSKHLSRFLLIMSNRIRVFGIPICSYNKFRSAGVVFGPGLNCFPCKIKNLFGMGFWFMVEKRRMLMTEGP